MSLRAIAIVFVLGLWSRPAGARCSEFCSCNWERDPAKAKTAASVVVSGTALDSTLSSPKAVDRGRETYRVRVVVRDRWKGSVPDTIMVRTADPAGGCGFWFERDQQYLLFLHRDSGGALWATMCSLSQPFSRATNVVRALGRPS